MNMKEFENRWKKAQGTSKTKKVRILNKARTIMYVSDHYSLYSDPRDQLVFLYNNGELIGYIKLGLIYIMD